MIYFTKFDKNKINKAEKILLPQQSAIFGFLQSDNKHKIIINHFYLIL